MAAKFELISDEQGRYGFTLKGADGSALLFGVATAGRVAVQNDILHVRKAVRNHDLFVSHDTADGAFVVLKDDNGEVLGKSPRVKKEQLPALIAAIQAQADAPILERKVRSQPASH